MTIDRSERLRRRPQLSEEVAGRVRHWIMTGEVHPGDFIRLDETAAALGVSVTPVREAMIQLRGEGMVDLVPHRGYVVSPLDRGDVEDIFWLQGQIAVQLVRRAVKRMSDADIDALADINDGLRAAIADSDTQRIEHLEFEFHRTLNLAAKSTKLAWFLFGAARYTPGSVYAADPEWRAFAVVNHDELIDALRRRDATTTARLTRTQFADGAARLIEHLNFS